MRRALVLFSVALSTVTAAAAESDHSRAMVRATPALVEISPQAAGARLVNLPSLEFPLQIGPRCGADARVESLVISVADTQKRFVGSDFADNAMLEATLQLPQHQIGPIAIEPFCAADSRDSDPDRSLNIRDAFSASISLRCSNDIGQTISFETLALEVRLLCKSGHEDEIDAAADLSDDSRDDGNDERQDGQAPSPASTRF